MSRAHFRHVRRTIYALKRRYPQAVGLYRSTGVTLNVETGVQSETVIKQSISRAILLPNNMSRGFSYDLAFIAANKEFTYGGLYDINTRRVLISRRDIPSTWPLDLDSWMVFKSKRWEILKVQEFEHDEAVMFTVKSLDNQLAGEIHDVSLCDTLALTDTASATVV